MNIYNQLSISYIKRNLFFSLFFSVFVLSSLDLYIFSLMALILWRNDRCNIISKSWDIKNTYLIYIVKWIIRLLRQSLLIVDQSIINNYLLKVLTLIMDGKEIQRWYIDIYGVANNLKKACDLTDGLYKI